MANRSPLVVGSDGLLQMLQSGDSLIALLNGNMSPKALGYNCWTADPVLTQTARTSTLNLFYLTAVQPSAAVASGGTLSVEFYVATAGASLTYGRIGIYSYSGGTVTLIGTSADLTTVVTTPGLKTANITLSASIAAGDTIYIGHVFVGTTAPALAGAVLGYTFGRGTPIRHGTSTQTTLPATFALSGAGNSSSLFFFAF